MSRLRLPAIVLAVWVIASLACSVATPTSTVTPVPPTQAAATSTSVPPTQVVKVSTPTSAPTSKPVATETRAPTARPTTAALPSGVLFSEDFGSQKAAEGRGWIFSTGENVDTTWSASRYVISVKRKNWLGLNWPDGTYDNFGVEADGQATGGSYAEYGIIFRVSGDQASRSYYIFGVNTDGKYYLQKKVNGEWADPDPVPAATSSYVKPKAKNTLGVLAQGNKISLYINGFLVKTVTDDSSTRGMAGVFAGTGANNDSAQVAFSRFTVLTVEKAKADWGTAPAADSAQPTATATKSGTGTGNGTIIVRNTFPGACQANLFGKQQAVIRAEGNSSKSMSLPPGTYGVHLAVDIGEVDLVQFSLPPGGVCVLTCDAATKAVYNSCR